MGQLYSDADKAKATELYYVLGSYRGVAAAMGITAPTIRDWLIPGEG